MPIHCIGWQRNVRREYLSWLYHLKHYELHGSAPTGVSKGMCLCFKIGKPAELHTVGCYFKLTVLNVSYSHFLFCS